MSSILSIPMTRLLWKDARILHPLFWIMTGLSLAFHLYVLCMVEDEHVAASIASLLLVGMPFMFAFGTGPMLISREKELGTLSWLKSMPIRPTDIFASKRIISLFFLVLTCCVTYLLNWWLRTARSLDHDYTPTVGIVLGVFGLESTLWELCFHSFLQSMLIVFVSLFLAWRFHHVLIGLAIALPLTVSLLYAWLVPEAMIDIALRSVGSNGFEFPARGWLSVGTCIFIFGWLGWRAANRYLADSEGSGIWTALWTTQWTTQRAKAISVSTSATAKGLWTMNRVAYAPSSALIWQFTKQNCWLVGISLCIFAMLSIGAAIVDAFAEHLDEQRSRVFLLSDSTMDTISEAITIGSGLAVWLGCCWLGVSTFQSDAVGRRRGFFAERGIGKWTVWWTRQMVPMSCVAMCIIVLTFTSFFFGFPATSIPGSRMVFWSLGSVLGILYSLSQWCSILIRHSVVTIVATPVISAGLLGGLIGVMLFEDRIYWIAASWIAIPLIASFCATRAWMDNRQGVFYWVIQAAFFGLLIATSGWGLLRLVFSQTIAPRELAALQLEANQLLQQPGSQPLRIPSPQEYLRDRALAREKEVAQKRIVEGSRELSEQTTTTHAAKYFESVADFRSYMEYVHGRIERKLAAQNSDYRPIYWPDPKLFRLLISEATLDRLAGNLESYQKNVRLIDFLAGNARHSAQLESQDRCDVMDLWLLRECRRSDAKEKLGDALYTSIVFRVSDWESRMTARREAVLVSWASAEKNNIGKESWQSSFEMGGYEIFSRSGNGTSDFLLQETKFRRMIRANTRELLACLEDRKQGLQVPSDQDGVLAEQRLQLLRRIGAIWMGLGRSYFEDTARTIAYADAIEDFDFMRQAEPCGLWFGKWEDEAMRLRRTIVEVTDNE